MSNVEIEIFAGLVVAAFTIVGGTAFTGWVRRQEESRRVEQNRQEQQRKDTGKRIGRLERYVDFQRGRQAGERARDARRRNRGRNE